MCNFHTHKLESVRKTQAKEWKPHKPTYKYKNNKINSKNYDKIKNAQSFSDRYNEYGIGFDESGNML